MINKNDPLIAAVQKVMQSNQSERDAVRAVNEKFGVTDRKALPFNRQSEWDAAYKAVLTEGVESLEEKKMTKGDIAALKHPKEKITGDDLAALRAGEHKMEEEKKMKGDDPCWKGYEMIGMKKKGGKEVPNCVPVKEQAAPKTDPYAEGQASSISTVAQPKKEVTPSDQSALTKKIKSVLKEKITKSTPAGKVISDFVHSDNPKFAGKSKEKRTKMALGAYYSKHPEKSKKVNEGFNDRHDLSVTASVEEQVVAEQTIPMGGSAPGIALRNRMAQSGQSQRFRPAGSPVRPVKVDAGRALGGYGNAVAPNMRTRATALRYASRAGQNPPLDPNRNADLDNPTTQSNMARAQNPNIGGAGGGNYAAAQTKRPPAVGQGASKPLGGGPQMSGSFTTNGTIKRPGPSFERTGRGNPPPSKPTVSTVSKDKPGSAQAAFDKLQADKAKAAEPKTMGAALKAAAARGEKETTFGGKKYKVAFKDKAYQAKKETQGAAFKQQQQVGQAQRYSSGSGAIKNTPSSATATSPAPTSTGTLQGIAPQTDTAKDLQKPVNQQSVKTLDLTAASRSLNKSDAVKELDRRQNIQNVKGA